MRFTAPIRLSSRTKLIALASLATLLPTTILSVIQYRSLVDLEGKTRAAVQENLRQTLQTVSRKVEDRLTLTASKALAPLDSASFSPSNFEALECQFAVTRQDHPAVDQIFVFSRCQSTGEPVGLFFGADGGLMRIDPTKWGENPASAAAIRAFDAARTARAGIVPRDFLFWQSPLPGTSADTGGLRYRSYVFHPLPCSTGGEFQSFAGIQLDLKYVQDKLIPAVVSGALAGVSDASGSDLAVAVFDESHNRLFASRFDAEEYEVKMALTPVFPRWDVAIGYKSTTVAGLARDNFKKNLMLTLFVLSLLIVGIILTLRATAREMRLAQAKSAFVSNVSHELKTPLALIRLFAETLELGRVRSEEKARDYYRIISNESRRLTQLINNILDFSKIEAGRKEYQFEESDVALVVRDVLQSYDYQITNSGFALKADVARDLPPALIDRDAVSQAVLNLLNNAIKYSGDEKEISVRVFSRGHAVAIEVADRGIGIPRSEHGKIFEKFYRVSTGLVHDTRGSGLGLALVKHIVEAHEGTIEVESTPGRGSRFTIVLPAVASGMIGGESRVDARNLEVAPSTHR